MTLDSSRFREQTGRNPQFEALAHERRRHVLSVLRDGEVPLTLRELAVEVARLERDATAGSEDRDRVDPIRLSLHHWHAPKLADAGLIEYDAEQNIVVPTDPTLRAADLHELLARRME